MRPPLLDAPTYNGPEFDLECCGGCHVHIGGGAILQGRLRMVARAAKTLDSACLTELVVRPASKMLCEMLSVAPRG
jgi:hypothetical protein